MSIHKTHERKAVSCSYLDADGSNPLEGKHVNISATSAAADDQWEEKKQVNNTGHFSLSFPADYSGSCDVKARGAAGGEVEGTIEV